MQNAVCKMRNTSKTKQNTYTQGPDCINRHTHTQIDTLGTAHINALEK